MFLLKKFYLCNEKSKNKEMNKRIKSFVCAFRGIWKVILRETNMKIDLAIAIMVCAVGFVLTFSATEWIFIVFAIGMVFAAETFNTAIERTCNMIERHYDRNIRTIKDISAGAVLLCAITAATIGIIIFLPKLIDLFSAEPTL